MGQCSAEWGWCSGAENFAQGAPGRAVSAGGAETLRGGHAGAGRGLASGMAREAAGERWGRSSTRGEVLSQHGARACGYVVSRLNASAVIEKET